MHNHEVGDSKPEEEFLEIDKQAEIKKIISEKLDEIDHWMIQAGLGTRVDLSKEGQLIGSVGAWPNKDGKEIWIDLNGHKVYFVLPNNYKIWQIRSTDGTGMTTSDLDEIIEALKVASADLDHKVADRKTK